MNSRPQTFAAVIAPRLMVNEIPAQDSYQDLAGEHLPHRRDTSHCVVHDLSGHTEDIEFQFQWGQVHVMYLSESISQAPVESLIGARALARDGSG